MGIALEQQFTEKSGLRDVSNRGSSFRGQCEAHFLYKPFFDLPNLSQFVGQFIEVRVERQYLTHFNPAIAKRRLWGNDCYTSNSDIVCILIHCGAYRIRAEEPDCAGVSVFFKVSRNRTNYNNIYKNGLKSRKTSNQNYEGHSIKFEGVVELDEFKPDSNLVSLSLLAGGMPSRP